MGCQSKVEFMRIETESGSIYEVDLIHQLVRRFGDNATRRCVGEWKKYDFLGPVRRGAPFLITWPPGTPLLDGTPSDALIRASTRSSRVVNFEHVIKDLN